MADSPFQLMQLPSDLLTYLVREHLPFAPALALAFTCKDAFKLLVPLLKTTGRIPCGDPRAKAAFCELLEPDVSDKYYFCPICPGLHPFSPSAGPSSSDFGSDYDTLDCRRCRWTLGSGCFTMGLHHVRLALNRHLFGPNSGISLDRFALQYSTTGYPSFAENWSAKIIDGDLFLASTRTTRWGGITSFLLLDCLSSDRYKLCEHTLLHELPALRPGGNFGLSIEECSDELGHCRQCFTDWTITASRERFTAQRWRMEINTYHRFPVPRARSGDAESRESRFQYDVEIIPLYREAGLVRDIWLGRASGTARAGRWVKGGVFGRFGDLAPSVS